MTDIVMQGHAEVALRRDYINARHAAADAKARLKGATEEAQHFTETLRRYEDAMLELATTMSLMGFRTPTKDERV